MPIYEYQCDACNRITEVVQKMSDAPLEKCEKCGKPVYKVMSRTSFQLKGSGWYASDYKKSSGSKESTGTSKQDKADCGQQTDGTCAKPDCGNK